MKKLYAAYGSNLNLPQMRRRCPDAEIVGAGVLNDYRLTFCGNYRGCGVATIEPQRGSSVQIGVFAVSAADEKSLDVYEGFPSLYRKENILVNMADGSIKECMVYIMNCGVPAMPSNTYYETIRDGYRYFSFNLRKLSAAKNAVERTIAARIQKFRFND